MNNKKNYLIQIASILVLIYAIFFKAKGDLTDLFSLIVIAYLMLSFLIEDKKTRVVHELFSITIFIMVWILGYGFDYFKF